ncbi:ester cyclase [Dyadobacter sp. CY326]|uniref:ester cyclase n=1 Tax=Dyadobacter sp. CY326 TaxID=2907300 RepID=UPI001F2A9205|nr:ester cyclase [Dyadobacter sp. CY326]MCE7063900.1 ester cyclase [Dyadobacter sp. CY326]
MGTKESTLLYRWFDQVWNKNDENAIGLLMTDHADFQGIETKSGTKGAPAFKLFFQDFTTQFHNIHIEVEEVISEGEMEAARTVITAKHAATGKDVVIPGLCMVKVESGQIAQAWNSYDFLSMHQQLGGKLVSATDSQFQQ